MNEPKKKPGVAFWATVVLVVALVAYPLSFGPACWMAGCGVVPMKATRMAYWPLVRITVSRQGTPFASYAELFSENRCIVADLYDRPPAPGELVIDVYPVIHSDSPR
jgi:hypothetical protein